MRSEVDVSLPDFRVSSSRSPMPSAFCVKRADAATPGPGSRFRAPTRSTLRAS